MRERSLKAEPIPITAGRLDPRELLKVLRQFRKGDFSARMPMDRVGLSGKIYDAINDVIELNERLTKELDRVSTVVGKEGKIRHRVSIPNAVGGWAQSVESVNLALTSKYQSEFLASMSHELRTPLNSILILSKLLSENDEGNLTAKQVEFAQTIHSSGDDLLALINEILDLSKIESGTMEVDSRSVQIDEIRDFVSKSFGAIADSKGLRFMVDIRTNAPKAISTDQLRLQQILKNLLSNAFKFTQQGAVTLRVESASSGWSKDHQTLSTADQVVSFSVIDTGIGIAPDKHKIIFEAFQQADCTTSRKYGGTGLGLSISREIAHLLGGEIKVSSKPEEGSTFTLYLPINLLPKGRIRMSPSFMTEDTSPASSQKAQRLVDAQSSEGDIPDDRDVITDQDRVLLVVEPDLRTAENILAAARERRFKVLVASNPEGAIELATEYSPDAVTLELEGEGWSVLDRLKHSTSTRHIPVYIISSTQDRQRAMREGARAFSTKPVTDEDLDEILEDANAFLERRVKNLLIVEDDETQRNAIIELVGNVEVQTVAVASGDEALVELRRKHFDCMVIDLGLPGMTGFQLLERLKKEPGRDNMPVIIYTGKDLSTKGETTLRKLAETIIMKDARSLERLVTEIALFLHRSHEKLPESARKMIEDEYKVDPVLAGKKILIIDDDVGNIFSMTSLLERHHVEVVYAENGADGIEMVKNTPDISAVIVDIMMPEMDGYETMTAIRKIKQFQALPIIALTAKAMKGDREKCIQAGASDYVSKPVDIDRLLSLLRVFLAR
jgi:signal transduction histidine kinase/CheY-like chemotaxis protein